MNPVKPYHIPVAIVISLIVFFLYIFQFSPDQRFTLFFINKAVGGTAIFLIGLSYLIGPLCKIIPPLREHFLIRKYFGLIGFATVLIHIGASLLQYTSRIPLQWYIDHIWGIIAAIGATVIFFRLAWTSNHEAFLKLGKERWKFIQRTGYIAVMLSVIHIAVASFPRWQMWWSGEVDMPLSLKLVAFIVIVLVIRLIALAADFSSSSKGSGRKS